MKIGYCSISDQLDELARLYNGSIDRQIACLEASKVLKVKGETFEVPEIKSARNDFGGPLDLQNERANLVKAIQQLIKGVPGYWTLTDLGDHA